MKTEKEIKDELKYFEKQHAINFTAGLNAQSKTEVEQAVENCRRYALKIQVLKWVVGEEN